MTDSLTPSPSPSPPLPPLPPGPRRLLAVPATEPVPPFPPPPPPTPEATATAYPDVFVELDKLQHKQGSWVNGVLLLVVSLVAFGAVGFTQWKWSWKMLALVVAVLLFHELGHYAAMRLFGYRNLKMLFIPFFGAAVIGRHYNVAGWKKAVVSLMGPVPGILLGIAVGVAGMVMGKPALYPAAGILLALNAFNLLPVLPLDGGWVMHTLYFSRSTVLDVIFRC